MCNNNNYQVVVFTISQSGIDVLFLLHYYKYIIELIIVYCPLQVSCGLMGVGGYRCTQAVSLHLHPVCGICHTATHTHIHTYGGVT